MNVKEKCFYVVILVVIVIFKFSFIVLNINLAKLKPSNFKVIEQTVKIHK